MAGTVPHENHPLIGGQRRHLGHQRADQPRVIPLMVQQRRADMQDVETAAPAGGIPGNLLVFIAVDNVQGLNRHIPVPLLPEFFQRLRQRIDE